MCNDFGLKRLASLPLTALVALAILLAPFTAPVEAQSVRTVPEGNRYSNQPKIPFASARRTAASQSSYDAKFEKVVSVIRRDRRLLSSIKRVASRYGIDPIHIIGAIVGEHTYNYDTLDSAQSYYVKALAYAGIRFEFEFEGEHVNDFVQRPQFERCQKDHIQESSDRRWSCYEQVWETRFRGKSVDGVRYPKKNFNEAFFQPLFAGQSFGLGQLSPLTVLKMTDKVSRTSKFRKLEASNSSAVYKATMDPNISLHYMAAIIKDAITAYKSVGKVDISNNPGLTATLYNLGDPWSRAAKFRRSGKRWPRENYYGWLVNDRIDDLKDLL
ncbi:DUF1402 family protein [Roseibium denhamense]|uniref:DUF1402 family protein n=1 Tax=Roseibium denhamense TaxID=76305 RepID=A0ABY1NFL3_9HYPH|nr:DUF1402 family protein [Roseibium denhamense]MTI04278.1 DUF1402 family protein [Roseibium denhamense]SMP07842.1 Protein of unknown function [Roseibium denhamense]